MTRQSNAIPTFLWECFMRCQFIAMPTFLWECFMRCQFTAMPPFVSMYLTGLTSKP